MSEAAPRKPSHFQIKITPGIFISVQKHRLAKQKYLKIKCPC